MDSIAALGIVQRTGIGRMKHIHTQALWVQEASGTGRVPYKKIKGEANPADLLTKYVCCNLINRHFEFLGLIFSDGRAATAHSLDAIGFQQARFIPQGLMAAIDKFPLKDAEEETIARKISKWTFIGEHARRTNRKYLENQGGHRE